MDGAGDVNGDGYDDVIVSAFTALDWAGLVHVYYGGPDGVSESRIWRYACEEPQAKFGHQVAGLGDVNGDGYDDILIGAPDFHREPDISGRVFAFYGSAEGLPPKPSWEYRTPVVQGNLGFSVGAAGDVNGDGYADALVGGYYDVVPRPSGAPMVRGYVGLFYGGPQGLASEPGWEIRGDRNMTLFGYSVAGAGDLNGDGYADLVISEPHASGARQKTGRVFVFYGSPDGPRPDPDWTIVGVQETQELGVSVNAAGDVNGDGYDDLIVAANRTSNGQREEGMVLVFFGSPTGLGLEPDWRFESNQVEFLLGHSVAPAGSVNGDRYGDIVIGAFYGEQVEPNEGVAMVFHGSRWGLGRRPDWTGRGIQRESGYGATVRSAGDVNGDGFADIVVGQPRYTGSLEYQGRAFLYFGSREGLSASSGWRPPGERFGFEFRSVVVPFPGVGWTSFLLLATGAAIFVVTRGYYRRRERTARMLHEVRESTLRAERDRVAQDLHDQLGAHITEIARTSGNARRSLDQTPLVERSLRSIEKTAGELVDSLDRIVWITQSRNDTLERTVAYLLDRIAETLEAADLACELDVPVRLPDIPIESVVRRDILLAVREALHNVIRHAGATRVRVAVAIEARRLRIQVEDDGCAEPRYPGEGRRHSGNGLANMEERMRRHGGSCTVRFEDRGTCVALDLPLPEPLP